MGHASGKQEEQAQKGDAMNRTLIVIPVFNNRKTLRRVVQQAAVTGLPVLVVNDGSTDGGTGTLSAEPVSLLNLPVNGGKGAAIRAGAQWAWVRGFTHIITIDADGQHDPADVPRFLAMIDGNPWSIIVGTRQFPPMVVPFSSRFGRRWSNMWFWISSGYSMPDSQSGFRAYPVAVLQQIRCHCDRYDFEIEILVRSAWAGLAITHTDVSVHYSEETRAASHFDPLLDNVRISKIYTCLVARNFTPWPHRVIFNRDGREVLSLRHPVRSFRVLLKESSSPRDMAFSVMLGVLLGALPLIGCHSIVIFHVATRLRLNRIAALAISNICAPPFVPALAVETGYFMRHGVFLTDLNLQTLGYEAPQRLFEYLLGSLIVGPAMALFFGPVFYMLILLYQGVKARSVKSEDSHAG